MTELYLGVKLAHVVSATVLLGTGLGTAFFMLQAYRSKSAEALRITSRHVVLADWLFTTPAIVVQLVTGLWLARMLRIPWSSSWLIAALALFAAVGLCWLPVVAIQIEIRRLTEKGYGPDYAPCAALMRRWIALGVPAFALTLALLTIMVLRPMFADR